MTKKWTNMEISLFEAFEGGELPCTIGNWHSDAQKTHSVTPREHELYLELQESWRRQEERERMEANKTSNNK